MKNARSHNFSVWWCPGDDEWIAKTDRFRHISWLADSPEEALAGLIKLLKEIQQYDERELEDREP